MADIFSTFFLEEGCISIVRFRFYGSKNTEQKSRAFLFFSVPEEQSLCSFFEVHLIPSRVVAVRCECIDPAQRCVSYVGPLQSDSTSYDGCIELPLQLRLLQFRLKLTVGPIFTTHQTPARTSSVQNSSAMSRNFGLCTSGCAAGLLAGHAAALSQLRN